MPKSEQVKHYTFAVGLTLVALGVRWSLHPLLGSIQPYAPGFVAIAASVFFWGWGPAVVAAVVAYVGGTVLFLQPGGLTLAVSVQGVAALLIFALSSGLIIFMGHRARRAEQQLAQANEQLLEADRKKDEFLATLSHELRNPLGVIATAVKALEGRPADPASRPTLAILARQVAQMQRLVDDLLDVGRISRGRMTLRAEAVDLRTCVEHAVEGCMDAVGRKRQSLVVSLPRHAVPAHVDAARIRQVLSNLIDNASKYSQAHADIRVNLTEDDGRIVIDVSDNGPGIAPDVLPHVFDLFDQGGASDSDGLGLGLGLCKRIVEMHGGTIAAIDNPRGRGTSFIISLPQTTEGTG
ncbi:MAG: HAMP domain-containing sensor histidine kinase [Vicinamibacterales bacterium]